MQEKEISVGEIQARFDEHTGEAKNCAYGTPRNQEELSGMKWVMVRQAGSLVIIFESLRAPKGE